MFSTFQALLLMGSDEETRPVSQDLRQAGRAAECACADTPERFGVLLSERPWDAVIAVGRPTAIDLAATVRRVRERLPTCPVLLAADDLTVEQAVAYMRAGIWDIAPASDPGRLVAALLRAREAGAPASEPAETEALRHRDTENLERLVRERTEELIRTHTQLADRKRLSDIGALAATVAHELRNPLGVIRTAAFNIRRKDPNPALERSLSNIDKKVMECDRIITNLLAYARIRQPQYEAVDLHALAEEAATAVQAEYGQAERIRLRRDLEALRGLRIEADPAQLKEILFHGLTNAFQALAKESGEVRICGELEGCGNIRLEICDTGGGIDPEDLPRVFDPFFTKKSKGTGLGLTIARELTSLHGGAIAIRSEKGLGTTVTIRLPIHRPSE